MGDIGIDVSSRLNANATKKMEEASTLTKVIGSSSAIAGTIALNKKVVPKYFVKIQKDFYQNIEDLKKYDVNNGKLFEAKMQNVFDSSGLKQKGCKIFDYSLGFSSEACRDYLDMPDYNDSSVDMEFKNWCKENPEKAKDLLVDNKSLNEYKEVRFDNKTFKFSGKYLKNNTQKNANSVIIKKVLGDNIPNKNKGIKYIELKYYFLKGWFQGKFKKYMNTAIDVKKGKDAFASSKAAHVNMKEYSFLLPHELGHLKDINNGGLGKVAYMSRGKIPTVLKAVAVPFILLTSILRDKKPEGEESSTVVGKSLDFIKENCVGLTALLETPTILEEGLASVRGLKMAKNHVTKQEFSMLKNLYKSAWKTYGFAAIASVGTVFVANSIKNFISAPKENPA